MQGAAAAMAQEPSASNGAQRPARGARLGELLVREGLVTQPQIDEALRVQASLDRYVPIGHVLIAQRLISRDQLVAVLERHRRSTRLGDLLVKSSEISQEQLETALAEQRRSGQPLGATLLRLNMITEERLRLALCRQLHIRFFNLDSIIIDPTLRGLVNERFALKHRVVPLARVSNTLVAAMDDPTMTRVVDDLHRSTGLRIEVITSTAGAITRALERLYRTEIHPRLDAGENVDVIAEQEPIDRQPINGRRMDTADEIVRKLLRVAIDRGASDIHLETIERRLRVRFRIDGLLQHFNLGDLAEDLVRQRPEVLSRIKILGGLDIAERRRPQDGSFRARVHCGPRVVAMDFRISVIPGYYGENAVIRILDPRSAPESIDALGLAPAITARLHPLLRSTAGILLVTGPTGSGKSTTLYGMLKSVYRPEIKVVTAEDPIEYVCNDFSQHEVDSRVGNSFAQYLRSFLRHDPEVIMIGEIRDSETAELAFRAAQTGHFIISTLHTNDAIGAVNRLKDLGVDANVCTSALLGVMAQRLVRQICWNCKQEYTPSRSLLESVFDVPPADFRWYRGAGCDECHQSGYRGRLLIAELWTPSDNDVMLINDGAPFDAIQESARKSTIAMADDIVGKLREGRITLEEAVRAAPHTAMRALRSMLL
jgi:type IV pilus assembly protein PilB